MTGLQALARKLSRSGDLADVSTDEIYPGPGVQDAAALDEYIRQTLHSANGLSGGCCMGKVVDQQLKVKGVGGLRVADASVMPSLPAGNTNATAIMIGDKGADHVLKTLRRNMKPPG